MFCICFKYKHKELYIWDHPWAESSHSSVRQQSALMLKAASRQIDGSNYTFWRCMVPSACILVQGNGPTWLLSSYCGLLNITKLWILAHGNWARCYLVWQLWLDWLHWQSSVQHKSWISANSRTSIFDWKPMKGICIAAAEASSSCSTFSFRDCLQFRKPKVNRNSPIELTRLR